MSTAFLRMRARLIASVCSGPGALARASSSAASASASRSILGRGFLIGLDTDMTLRLIPGVAFRERSRRGFRRTWGLGLVVRPTRRIRAQRIGHLDPGFGMGALWPLVVSMLESFRSRRHRNRYHPRLAVGAARTVDWQQLWIRSCPQHIQKIASTENEVHSVPDQTPSKSCASGSGLPTLVGGA